MPSVCIPAARINAALRHRRAASVSNSAARQSCPSTIWESAGWLRARAFKISRCANPNCACLICAPPVSGCLFAFLQGLSSASPQPATLLRSHPLIIYPSLQHRGSRQSSPPCAFIIIVVPFFDLFAYSTTAPERQSPPHPQLPSVIRPSCHHPDTCCSFLLLQDML